MSRVASYLTSIFHSKQKEVEDWFQDQFKIKEPFFYNSVDLRHSGDKIVPVDNNIYPAGFNNLSSNSFSYAKEIILKYWQQTGFKYKKILLVIEPYTRNLNYCKNISRIVELLNILDVDEVRVGVFCDAEIKDNISLLNDIYKDYGFNIELVLKDKGVVKTNLEFEPDVIIVNNDMTSGRPEVLTGIDNQDILPPINLGWYRRRKNIHFDSYKKILNNFAETFNFDPFFLFAQYQTVSGLDFKQNEGLDSLAKIVEEMLLELKETYKLYSIKKEPYLYIKSNMGTHGMGIMTIREPADIYNLNKKGKNKMSKIKSNVYNQEVIVQEGIETVDTIDKYPAEPFVYYLGGELIGTIYRINTKKNVYDNLNSTGNFFKGVDMKDLPFNHYVYEIPSRLSVLASTQEIYKKEKIIS